MYGIKITVVDVRDWSTQKPNKYNTFWDEHGNLCGKQSYLVIKYEIELCPSLDE